MEKGKRRTKQEVRADKFNAELELFLSQITQLGCRLVDPKDVKKDVIKESLIKPKRVKDETLSQLSYE